MKNEVVYLLAFMLLGIPLAFSDTVTWQGSTSSSWSEPTNWDTGSVPTLSDDVVISGSSDLSLDINAEVASFDASSFGGAISLNDKTLTINTGDFNGRTSGLDAGTSTINFTGSADQWFNHDVAATYHIVANNKSGGILRYDSWETLTLDTLQAAAGTTTELSRVGRLYTNKISINGEENNRSVLRTGAAGERCIVHLLKGDGNNISYTDIRDVWADSGYGMLVDASDSSSNDGNNRGISFNNPVSYYDGGAADDNFSSPENWSDDLLPGPNSILHFHNYASANGLILDQDIAIGGINIRDWQYSSTIDFGTYEVSIKGDVYLGAGSRLSSDYSTLKLIGDGDQIVEEKSDFISLTFTEVHISDEDRFVDFNSDLAAIDLEILGGEVRFGAGKMVAVTNLTVQGRHDSLINLRPQTDIAGTTNTPWYLTVTGTTSIAYANVLNSDASGGLEVVADTSIDQGQNVNWSFIGTPPSNGGVEIILPTSSNTSPAFVEGKFYWNPSSFNGVDHSGAVTGQILSESEGFINLALDPSGAATAVSVDFNSDSNTEVAGLITWNTTDLAGTETSTIRQGDSLLLTYNNSTHFKIDHDSDGVYEGPFASGSLVPALFDQAGAYSVSVLGGENGVDFQEVSTYNVIVVGVSFNGPIAAEVGFERGKNVVVTPATEKQNIDFSSSDEGVVEVRLHEYLTDGARLSLSALRRGTSSLIARLPNGQIVSAIEIDEFSISYSVLERGFIINGNNNLANSVITMRPYVPGIDFDINMFGALNTFQDGSIELLFSSDDFVIETENGENIAKYSYNIFVPPESTHMCHGVDLFQGADDMEEINTTTVNVVGCIVTVEEDGVCPGEEASIKVTVEAQPSPYTCDSKSLQFYLKEQGSDTEEYLGSQTCEDSPNTETYTKTIPANYNGNAFFDLIIKESSDDVGSIERVVAVFMIEEIELSSISKQQTLHKNVLCVNQGEVLDLEIKLKQNISPIGLGEIFDWETTEGGKLKVNGELSTTVTADTTVKWEQADGFVSGSFEDIVIKAKCGSAPWTELKLTITSAEGNTIFAAPGQSMVESNPTVKFLPEDTDDDVIKEVAKSLNEKPLEGTKAWKVKWYDPATQGGPLPAVKDLFTSVFVKVDPNDSKRLEFKVSVKTAAQPGNYWLYGEGPNGDTHKEHIVIVKITGVDAPRIACRSQDFVARAITEPEDITFPLGQPKWQFKKKGDDGSWGTYQDFDPARVNREIQIDFDDAGTYKLEVKFNSYTSAESDEIHVVEMEEVSATPDVVIVGDDITLTATPNPDESLPADLPKWKKAKREVGGDFSEFLAFNPDLTGTPATYTTEEVGEFKFEANCGPYEALASDVVAVIDQVKVPLGGSTDLNKYKIGRVYVPTKWGGKLEVFGSNSNMKLFKVTSNGKIISDRNLKKVYKGEKDDKIVAEGSTIEYEVPEGKYKWFYIVVEDEQDTEITTKFTQEGIADEKPYHFWYFPFNVGASFLKMYADPIGPMRKYDAHFNLGTAAFDWEFLNHRRTAASTLNWHGHCWGGSVASAIIQQPTATAGFTQDDLEGLTAEFFHKRKTTRLTGSLKKFEYLKPTEAEDEVVDGYTWMFHDIMREELLTFNRVIIMDLREETGAREEKWNHAVFKYVCEMVEDPDAEGDEDKEKVRQIKCTTEIHANDDFVTTAPHESEGDVDTHAHHNRVQETEYILLYEFNGKLKKRTGEIAGRKANWLSMKNGSHDIHVPGTFFNPAKLRKQFKGTRRGENPEIKVNRLKALGIDVN